jgi:hypothetical protein
MPNTIMIGCRAGEATAREAISRSSWLKDKRKGLSLMETAVNVSKVDVVRRKAIV